MNKEKEDQSTFFLTYAINAICTLFRSTRQQTAKSRLKPLLPEHCTETG